MCIIVSAEHAPQFLDLALHFLSGQGNILLEAASTANMTKSIFGGQRPNT